MDLDPFLGFQVDPDRNGKSQGPSRCSLLGKMMLLMTDVALTLLQNWPTKCTLFVRNLNYNHETSSRLIRSVVMINACKTVTVKLLIYRLQLGRCSCLSETMPIST